MSSKLNEDFTKMALGYIDKDVVFEPLATYDEDGDCMEFLISNESFYAKRIDDLVTVYYSRETDEIVGSLIKGVSKYINKLKERFPGFLVEIHEGSNMLGHFFLVPMWERNMEPMQVHIYKELQEAAERTKVLTPKCIV